MEVIMKRSESFFCSFFYGIASIGKGMASLMSPVDSPSYEERFGTDAQLLASDWRVVDNDMKIAIKHFEKELKKNKPNSAVR